ncbi:MAG TPA: T9SS type A sorting domain-containing protein [Ignavibacteria bacterium]|nr:T9SS type A sorting domain-containing protein [Ignavibacteria bacterium]HMR39680.1 T9SS type A sorting domain-containing protein [Ignavibacteria bacterium]
MKKIKNLMLLLMIMILFNTTNSFSTTHNVSVSNFSFTPLNLNVTVGDTVKWTRVSGSHTTTCDGSEGSTRPAGAPSWDSPITSGIPTFSYVVTVAGMYHYVCLPHAPDMAGNINAVVSGITNLSELVSSYELSQNYPNPFNPETNINFSIPLSSDVKLSVYNVSGQEVASLVNERLDAGTYKVDWNAVNFTSGIYYYTIRTENFVQTRKMLLIK